MSDIPLDIRNLTVAQRISLIDQLYESLHEGNAESGPDASELEIEGFLSPAEQQELQRRIEALKADPSRAMTWEQVLARVREPQ